jgi:hypothetical protein
VSVLDARTLPTAVFGSSAARSRELTEWDAAIRRPRSTTRRIGFVSLEPGSGSTTLAALVTRTVAARRAEPVLAVDVSSDDRGLARAIGIPATPADATRAAARTTDDARTGLTAGQGWFGLHPATTAHAPEGAVGAWLAEAAPITRFFEVVLTDFGVRHPLVDLAACAALCDVVCLVSDARRSQAELVRAVAPAIAELPETPTPVLALVDHARAGDAVARALESSDAWPVVGIPFDRAIRAGEDPRGLASRRAVLRLAATLVGGVEAA